MDTFERANRVNLLAKELMKHGFVKTSDDALIQAEKMLDGKASIDGKQEQKQEVDGMNSDVEKQVQNIVNMNEHLKTVINDRLEKNSKDIKMLIEKMNELIKELNDVKVAANRVSRKTLSENEVPPKKEEIEQRAEQQAAPAESEEKSRKGEWADKEEGKGTSRTGSFTPKDVAIDKFFYFGKK